MFQLFSVKEKIGYGLGDVVVNLVWCGVLVYFVVFYIDIFGISVVVVVMLFLVVWLFDGVIDIIMGMIVDCINIVMGKFWFWILVFILFLGLFMILCFIILLFLDMGKLVYVYIIYIGLILVYIVNNVFYLVFMGVMIEDDYECIKLFGFWFVGVFFGGLLVMGFLFMLVVFFGGDGENDVIGYQYIMYVFVVFLVVFMLIMVFMIKEWIILYQ